MSAQPDQAANATIRLTILAGIVITLIVLLVSRLWYLQVLSGENFVTLAEQNRVKTLVVDAPRGRILAADGRELVKNRPAPTISADRKALINGLGRPVDEEAERVLDRLAVLLQTDTESIIDKLVSRRYSPFRSVPIAEDVAPETVFALVEHAELFPGIVAETLPVRSYPHGTLAAHLVGYVGEISDAELELDRYTGYRAGDLIGWAGLEKTYESQLRGNEGLRQLEVNARGVVLRTLSDREPVRGNDLRTSIDLDLQIATEEILEDGIEASRFILRRDGRYLPSVAGAAVVLDPRDGSVVAMASYPTYEPSEFVGGVSFDYWGWLQDEANEYPLINRAVQSAHPPGSVFKVVSGAAMLEAGHITPSTRISCPPSWNLGRHTFRNWNPRHDGSLDLADALKRSCDTFFYELAARQWAAEERRVDEGLPADEALTDMAERFGLGDRLGIDVPSEQPGVIPGRAWRTQFWEATRERTCAQAEIEPPGYYQTLLEELCLDGGRWRGGDAVNSSIGQGDVLTTPLQIAAAYAAIANGGTVHVPRIVQEVLDVDGEVVETIPVEIHGELGLAPDHLAELQEGLDRVINVAGGTARGAFSGFPLDEHRVAGKTGTAEQGSDVPFAWFASYAPVEDPRYVVVVMVDQGGGGSQTAAPIARRIYEAAFGVPGTPFAAGPANVD